MSFDQFGSWLLQCTVWGAIILSIGGLAILLCRQPAYRTGIIVWTFLGCLLVPAIRESNLLPTVSLGIWSPPGVRESVVINEPMALDPAGQGLADSSATAGLELSSPRAMIEEPHVSASAAIETPVHPSNSSPAGDSKPTSAALLPWLAFSCKLAYVVALGGIGGFWTIGLVHRRRIERTAVAADAMLWEILDSIAGHERSRRVRLLVSDKTDAPIMWGTWRPTIVVPRRLASDPQSPHLRYGLAHEWAHARRGDYLAYVVANVAKLVCFHQPVYWWLRKQLILSQDFLADAFAAQQAQVAEDYADYLVSLARNRRSLSLAGTLGVRDRKSRLLERVQMLVSSNAPPILHQRRLPAILINAVTAALILALGAVRLGAQAPTETPAPPGVQQKPLAETKPNLPEPITYAGEVVDADTGEPIAGATVEIIRSLNRDPVTRKRVSLETTEHVSDANGQYSFTLPPEQVAEVALYLEVDAHHPDYQPKGRSGYAHSMILRNLENGEPPFYSTIKLYKGTPVFATVLKPDGTPAADVTVLAYTKAPSGEPGRSFERGAFQRTRTDDRGSFQIVCATPGDGVVWIYPDDYSPVAVRIGEKRGDLGPIHLQAGQRVSGQVLDAKGKPVPNVAVELRRRGDGDEADEFLNQNAVANGIRAATKTDGEGRFQLSPLPPGTYRARIEDHVSKPGVIGRPEKLEVNDVFVPLEVTLTDAAPEPLEIRAIPHVLVRGRFFNSKGEPRASHQQHIFGRMNGQSIFTQSNVPGPDGWFEFKLPHGIDEVEISFTTNEHSSLRWRLRPDEPLQHGRRAHLGRLEEDFTTLEVVRYTAPILLLKAVDEQGKQLRDFVPSSKYGTRPATGPRGTFIRAAQGDVRFEAQPDGRWRSTQLLPDEEVTISLKKEGYVSEPQTVSIKEGDTRELVFVLKPATDSAPSEQSESPAGPQ